MFKLVIQEEVESGVGSGGLSVNAYGKVGVFSGYMHVQEVESITGFQGRA
jgi:hypothetical protein